MKHLYFDYAASTPIDPAVLKEINSNLRNNFGNPGSLHYFGQNAMALVDESREKIAKSIGANFREIIFTGSATESNNIALRGITQTIRRNTQKKFGDSQRKVSVSQRPRLIVSALEHESILETARDLEKEGVEVIYLKVDKNGVVDLKQLEKSLNERTILVSIIYANNETGVIQPISKISEIIRNFREKHHPNPNPYTLVASGYPLFHTDAVQAFQYLDFDVKNLGVDPVTHTNVRYGVDLMTLSAHKIYGPKGIGALFIREGSGISPIIVGGGQEFGLRSGTENVAAIAGFAKAIELADKNRQKEKKRISRLAQYFFKEIKKIIPSVRLNAEGAERLPNILNIVFSGYDAENLLIKFDLNGIAVSRGSACMARSSQSSYVLKEMGLSESEQRSSLRFSFGRFTTKEEMSKALKIIKKILK